MRRRDKLYAVRKYAKDSGPIISFYSSRAIRSFGNIRYLRLMIIDGDVVSLLPCTVVRGQFSGVKRQGVRFSRHLCRIKGGPRSGMYITHNRLRVGEVATEGGLEKRLSRGAGAINASNDKDKVLIDRMFEAIQDPLDSDELLCPSYYIRTKNADALTPRLEGHVTKRFMSLEEYDDALPFEDNFHNLVGVFACDDPSSAKHKLYPLDMVQGPGLMMFDADTMPPPQVLPLEILRKGYELTEIDI